MSDLELLELGLARVFRNHELQTRADQNSWSEYRLQFLASHDGHEVAFISFDLSTGKDYLVLYELFVVAAQRGRGLGSKLIVQAEILARGRGLQRLLVLPRSLAEGISDEWLRGWYNRRGFQPWPDDTDFLAKDVARRVDSPSHGLG